MRHGLRERAAPILAFGGTAAAAPALLLHFFGRDTAAIDGGWHFFGVDALKQVLADEREPVRTQVAMRPTSGRRARTLPPTPAAETS